MVPIEKENVYQLRDYFHSKVIESAHIDPFKSCFLVSWKELKAALRILALRTYLYTNAVQFQV